MQVAAEAVEPTTSSSVSELHEYQLCSADAAGSGDCSAGAEPFLCVNCDSLKSELAEASNSIQKSISVF